MLVSRIAGMILLVPALPAIIILVMLVEITSPGPGIYRQRRVGLRGKPFTLYKIRTMLRDAEARTGPVWTAPNDPRITKLGRLLRPLHLDELPQLFNVVMGQMTLIGPRPERPEFTQYLARQIPGYLDRFSVMPGITGLAQINLPPDTDLDSVRRKLVLDVEYIRTARLKLDMQIFFCTALRLIGVPGEAGAKLARVVREAPIPDWMRLEDAAESSPMTYHEPRSETLRPAVGVAQRLACEGDLPVA
jgi:lipopolysaccharide/colanic/teichoic acid biosynthesis glycosyltransferase